MKVLQINCVYKQGSTGKITYDLHTALRENGETSVVCYGRGPKNREPDVHKTCSEFYGKWSNLRSRFTGLMYGGCCFSTQRLFAILRREKPDVVHLQCINGYFVNIYQLINWLKKNRIKTVLTLHAEFMYTANCGYALECGRWLTGCGNCPRLREATRSLGLDRTAASWQKMRRAFSGFERDCVVVSVSDWLRFRAQQSPILRGFRQETVLNGIDARRVFRPVESAGLLESLGISRQKMIFHVTAQFSALEGHPKGGAYIVELAKRMPDVAFVVAAERDSTPAEGIPLPENLYRLGKIEDQTRLAAWYAAADVTVIASTRETFSMVAAESLCCGTPVVGFRAGGPETIALEQYATFVEPGNILALQQAAEDWLNRETDAAELVALACRKYDKSEMCAQYRRIYRRLCGEKNVSRDEADTP